MVTLLTACLWRCSAGSPVPAVRGHQSPSGAIAPPGAGALECHRAAGRRIFQDPEPLGLGAHVLRVLPRSGQGYGPPDGASARLGGADGGLQGARAVPGLRYLYRAPNFSIGPDINEMENVDLNKMAVQSAGLARAQKTVGAATAQWPWSPRADCSGMGE